MALYIRESKAKQSKAKQSKAKQSKAKQSKAKQYKGPISPLVYSIKGLYISPLFNCRQKSHFPLTLLNLSYIHNKRKSNLNH
jgi:hypothetical protein